MVTVVPPDNKWEGLASVLGSAFQGYQNTADEKALQNTIQGLPQDASPRQILDAITMTSTYSPQAKQTALNNYLGVVEMNRLQEETDARNSKAAQEQAKAQYAELQKQKKLEEERQQVRSLVGTLDIPEDQKDIFAESLDLKTVRDLVKSSFANSGKESPFQAAVSRKLADEYVELPNEIAKLESNAGDIQAVRNLSNDIGALTTIAANLGIKTTKGEELGSIGYTLMQPIVKMFNPSGPIAERKLRNIQEKYALSPSDASWVRTAKLNALERFNTQALDRANKRLELIEAYAGRVPSEELKKFDKQTETLSDAMESYNFKGTIFPKEDIPEKFRDPKKFKGMRLKTKSGKWLKSDGENWYEEE